MDRQIKLFLTNSLSRKKEEFHAINPADVKMYVCGPTVYDRPHLGNARAAVVYDVLFRVLKAIYERVVYVRNITDIDDKIIKAARENNESIKSLTQRMTQYYHDDMASINCIQPTHEPKATEQIDKMLFMIQKLIDNGHAYVAQKHVLFSVDSFKEYGLLSGRSREEMIAGARVEVAPFKKDPADFVLWKPALETESDCAFPSPWGLGRPGWHIECSAMSLSCLGEEFDIHGGGADLMFPHHENEIAQSYCANGYGKFAKHWVHNGFLTINGDKMSKSLGNFKTVRDLLNEGEEGVVIRYLYLTTHYRKPLDFTSKALEDARKSIVNFRSITRKLSANLVKSTNEEIMELLEILCDDLNTPNALAKLHEYAHLAHKGSAEYALKLLLGAEFLGLDLHTREECNIPQEILNLVEARKIAKSNRDWKEADRIRNEISKMGYEIRDIKDLEYILVKY